MRQVTPHEVLRLRAKSSDDPTHEDEAKCGDEGNEEGGEGAGRGGEKGGEEGNGSSYLAK